MTVNKITIIIMSVCCLLGLPSVFVVPALYLIKQEEFHSTPENNTNLPDYLEMQSEVFAKFAPLNGQMRYVFNILKAVFGMLGIFGNSTNLVVMCRNPKTTFSTLLMTLSTFDMILIISYFAWDYDVFAWERTTWCKFIIKQIGRISMTGSIWTMIAASTDRYLGICRPFATKPGIWFYLFLVLSLSLVVSLGRTFDFNTELEWSWLTVIEDEREMRFQTYWIGLTVLGIIPLVTLILMNSLIYANIKQSVTFRRSISQDSTRTSHSIDSTIKLLFGIVPLLLICSILRIANNIFLFKVKQPSLDNYLCQPNYENVYKIFLVLSWLTDFFTLLNSSVNFFFFCIACNKFRGAASSTILCLNCFSERNIKKSCSYIHGLEFCRIRNGNHDTTRQTSTYPISVVDSSINTISTNLYNVA